MSAQLDHYQSAALTTAIYPKEKGLEYTALGLCGEIGEIACKVGGWDFSRAVDRDDVNAELGDGCWFVAAHAYEIGVKLSELTGALAPSRADLSPIQLVLLMSADAGEIAGKVSKVIRDGRAIATIRQHQIEKLASILIGMAALAAHAGISIEIVMSTNLAKLSARKSKGTLTGDGDKR
jgi:NTP pyrophosphatase (non-canonical NTP hydrolase)